MARNEIHEMLRSMSERIGEQPPHVEIAEQLHVLLNSHEPFFPAASQLGRLLLDAGLLDDANQLYSKLTEHFPERPTGLVGLARVAMRGKSWQDSLNYWDQVLERFGDKPLSHWLEARAITLIELRRFRDAENAFRVLTQEFNDEPQGFAGLARLAMSRTLWTEALKYWDEALSRSGDQAKLDWHFARATALSHLDRLDEADSIYQRLADNFPGECQGFVGLASTAMQRHKSQDALSRWDEVLARFPKKAATQWRVSRGNALLALGRGDEAEAGFRSMVQSAPRSLIALTALLRALSVRGKPEEALIALESSRFASLKVPDVIERKFDILIGLKRFADAREEFRRLLSETGDTAMLNSLFTYAAPLHNRWQRTEIFIALLRKVEGLAASELTPRSVAGLRARILLALRDYERFLSLIDGTGESDLGEHWRGLLAVAAKLRASPFPDYHATKIFGVGLCRTGTTSLAAALSSLGFHTLDWVNPLTRELMCEDDFHLFDAFTDAPACAEFEKQYFMFPNSKFIYTVRPLESWKKSMKNLFSRVYGQANFNDLKAAIAQPETVHYGEEFSNIYLSLYFNHKSYEQAYHLYDRRVRTFFQDKPKDRFLEFDVFAGNWDELCAFTGRPKPEIPFPWLNRKL